MASVRSCSACFQSFSSPSALALRARIIGRRRLSGVFFRASFQRSIAAPHRSSSSHRMASLSCHRPMSSPDERTVRSVRALVFDQQFEDRVLVRGGQFRAIIVDDHLAVPKSIPPTAGHRPRAGYRRSGAIP